MYIIYIYTHRIFAVACLDKPHGEITRTPTLINSDSSTNPTWLPGLGGVHRQEWWLNMA
jgi:hypothetical protein